MDCLSRGPTVNFVFSAPDPELHEYAKSLLFWGHCVDKGDPNKDALLVLNEAGLGIHEPKRWNNPSFLIDFTTMDIRTGSGNVSRKQPLARAVGRHTKRVLELTSGFGSDTSLLAGMGYQLECRERHPVVYALLQDALGRAAQHPLYSQSIANKIRLQLGEARDVGSSYLRAFDAVYVDPMYPPKKSKAAPPRRAQLLQMIAGEDLEQQELLFWVRKHAKRMVVKRPKHAPPALEEAPHHQVESKMVRWDVWLNQPKPT